MKASILLASIISLSSCANMTPESQAILTKGAVDVITIYVQNKTVKDVKVTAQK